jgi:hypothetical protein
MLWIKNIILVIDQIGEKKLVKKIKKMVKDINIIIKQDIETWKISLSSILVILRFAKENPFVFFGSSFSSDFHYFAQLFQLPLSTCNK